jgi:peptidoglycan/xylan/chitin deacetylase (PgdA/CDA1 family)
MIAGRNGRRKRNRRLVAVAGALIAGGTTVSVATAAGPPAATARTTPPFAPPCPTPPASAVTRAPGSGKTVALTIDDGPAAETPAMLAALAKAKVRATFFVVGSDVGPNAAVARQTAAAGHLVANHSWDHAYPSRVPGGWTTAYLTSSLRSTNAAILTATGTRSCWFRPPGGFMPSTVLPAARAQRMGVALWSVDPRDWQVQAGITGASARRRGVLAKQIAQAALAGTSQSHPIVLLHDGGGYRGATTAAIPMIVDGYRRKGFTFVTLDGRR